MAGGDDHACFFQGAEMSGGIDLGDIQNVLQVADAEWGDGEEVQNTETCLVAEALVDLDKVFHIFDLYT